jgi:hypothetical protein
MYRNNHLLDVHRVFTRSALYQLVEVQLLYQLVWLVGCMVTLCSNLEIVSFRKIMSQLYQLRDYLGYTTVW